ncbi:MAG: autoinducer binding domain-containing protein [Hyphomonadaceae bacterium]
MTAPYKLRQSERLLDFVVEAAEAKSRNVLEASLLRLVGEFGAARFLCAYVVNEGGAYVPRRSISNVPVAWQHEYLARGYDSTDPVFDGAINSGAHGFWNERTRWSERVPFDSNVFDFARQLDMEDGFTSRVTLSENSRAIVMIAGRDLDHSARGRAAFRVAADIFAREGVRLLGDGGNGPHEDPNEAIRPLTVTQLTVLRLRAEDGLSLEQVAVRMNVTRKTVESHVTQIIRRLGARNFLHAVQIARRNSLF